MAGRVRSSPGRGRPHRPSRPLHASGVPGSQERIAWLLRTNRRYSAAGPDPRLATFAAAVSAAGCPVSAGQLSRWESGCVPVPYRAVRAYEMVLGLPRNGLVSVADAVHRQHTARSAPSRLDRLIRPDDEAARVRAEDLLDRAVYGGEMAGADWDGLTALLTAFPQVVMPGRLWDELTGRLLREQLVADGRAWRQRSESTHRLLWLPAARTHMVAACAALARDPASQIVIEPLAVLDVVDHPDAAALLVEQLVAPVSERARRGALAAAAVKARHHQFTSGQLSVVRAALRERAAEPGRRGWRGTAARIAGWVLARTPGYADPAPDDLLARIVGEMLFSPDPETRLHAAQLAGATPLRSGLADAFCAELARPAVARDPAAAGALVGALPFLAGPEHRPVVERMVVSPGVAAADPAAWSLAHLPGRSSDAFWAAALRRRLPGVVYALGVAGQTAWLRRIAGDPGQPAEARVAARWWSNLPAAVVRDARR